MSRCERRADHPSDGPCRIVRTVAQILPRGRCESGLDEYGLTQRVVVSHACREVSPQPIADEVLAVVLRLAGRVDTCRPVNCSPTPVGEETVHPPLNPALSAVVTRFAVAPFFQAVRTIPCW